jgi:hypothetical protein
MSHIAGMRKISLLCGFARSNEESPFRVARYDRNRYTNMHDSSPRNMPSA